MNAASRWGLPILVLAACAARAPEALPGPPLPACRAWGFGDGTAVDVSPDGTVAAVGGESGLVQLYRTNDGAALGRFFDHHGQEYLPGVLQVRFSDDGKQLAVADCCSAVTVWRVEDGVQLARLAGAAPVAFSPDGKVLVSAAVNGRGWDLAVFRVDDGSLLATASGHRALISDVVTFPSGDGFRSISHDESIRTWGFDGHELRATVAVPPFALRSGVLSRDGTRYALADEAGAITLGSADTGMAATTVTLPVASQVRGQFEPGGGQFVTVGGGDATFSPTSVWSIAFGSSEPVVLASDELVLAPAAFAFLPDGQSILAAGPNNGISRWQLGPPFSEVPIASDMGEVVFLTPGPGENRLLAVEDTGVSIRDLVTGAVNRTSAALIVAADRSRDVPVLAAAESRAIHLWRITEDGELVVLPSIATTADVLSVALSADGRLLAAALYGGLVKRWNVQDGVGLPDLQHGRGLSRVLFSPDGTILLSSGYSATDASATILWSAQAGEPVGGWRHPGGGVPMAYSPDGQSLVETGPAGAVSLIQASDGVLIRRLEGKLAAVSAVAFSPDGSLLAAGGGDRVRVWRVADGMLLHAPALSGRGQALVFSADGRTLWGGGREKTIRTWCLPEDGLATVVTGWSAGAAP